jgi:CheY-like chemotaxis protein
MSLKKTILHADDVERWRDLVEGRLTPEFTVVSVDDCDKVLPRLAQGGIDLVILDLLMPGSDPVDSGYEVLQQIRSQFPALPVVMFTGAGFGSSLDREELQAKWDVPIVFKHDDDGAEKLRERVVSLLE